ncbi:hypothetical protein [Paenibacillus yanchengensis]|uniref:ABC transporter permease n=1 Tax=Paenibacillus yanchengensis TaxID=2035833 RepID=A0ABW4YJB6_9BACL
MSTWRGAWMLLKHDMKSSGSSIVFIIAFLLYLTLMLVPFLVGAIKNQSSDQYNWIIDLLYITVLLTSLSAVGGRLKWLGWLTTPFSEKIVVWRTLPITSEQITVFRIMQLFIVAFSSQLVFYMILVAAMIIMKVEVVFLQLFLFACFWFCIGLMINFVTIYLELVKSAKVYSIGFYGFAIVQVVVILVLGIVRKSSLVLTTLALPTRELWIYSTVALIVLSAIYLLGWQMISRKMRERSFIV